MPGPRLLKWTRRGATSARASRAGGGTAAVERDFATQRPSVRKRRQCAGAQISDAIPCCSGTAALGQ